ncbi:NAD(P)-binding domain-containing protein [Streptomyces sp. DW26H14]|uniref:NAD(P)-binding domain-containing protein n=1 Tax=Streptomyces sp. DW26H14 TaxID=3435395 RepID=UPI00403E30F6
MKIGTIGAGTVARAIARHAVAHGHQVVLSNSRGPASLAALAGEIGPLARAGTPEEAAAAELVVLAVGWAQIPDAVDGLPPFGGRVVVDATNQFLAPPPHAKIADLGELTGSEWVASLLNGARLVKAFNTLYGQYIAADPRHPAGRQVLFLAGDDTGAKTTVGDLTAAFGFAPVDLGSLREGGRLMQLGGPLSGLHALKQD